MDGFLILVGLAFLAFTGFVIYFIFKNLQFVIQAVNLYKKMIERQDMMIQLLGVIKEQVKLLIAKSTIK